MVTVSLPNPVAYTRKGGYVVHQSVTFMKTYFSPSKVCLQLGSNINKLLFLESMSDGPNGAWSVLACDNELYLSSGCIGAYCRFEISCKISRARNCF